MKNGPYILIKPSSDYPGKRYRDRYCYEHHYIWWKHKGQLVPDGYNIHHKNEIKTDNRIENLELLHGNDHRKEHAVERSEKSKILLVCPNCNNKFKHRGNEYRAKLKKGKNKNFYCNRKCYLEYIRK